MSQCNVCQNELTKPIYSSGMPHSLTSLCDIIPGYTMVYFCTCCGHVQTNQLENTDQFYDTDYKILIDSEDEDQLYAIKDGVKIYRGEHQANTVLSKVDIPRGAKILDYGAAKGHTIRKLLEKRSDLIPHVFDVSDMYKSFWDKFVPSSNQACYETPASWNGRFDLITSFYVAEHVVNLESYFLAITNLLAPGGTLFFTVPNILANVADFLVVDHVNHFTWASLRNLLAGLELENITIDDKSHDSAFVVTARKPQEEFYRLKVFAPENQQNLWTASDEAGNPHLQLKHTIDRMANYWRRAQQEIVNFERSRSKAEPAAVYGSGFYGAYITSCLEQPESVSHYLDANPYRQGKQLFGKQVIAPGMLPDSTRLIYVGLNPRIAKEAMARVPGWEHRSPDFFFLPELTIA
jgi:SAM-dependent methyltransferase